MKENLTILGSIIAVNLDWIDPLSKGVIALVALVTGVIKVLEYLDSKKK